MLRVAVNAEQLLQRSPGGIGRYTSELLKVMPRTFEGDEMLAFTARHPVRDIQAAFAAAGLDIEAEALSLPRPALYEAWHTFGVPKLPDRWEADIVHAPSLAVPPKGGAPLVVTVHDAAADLFPDAFTRWGRRFHRKGMAAAAKRADLVVTVSEAAAQEISDNSAIRPDRIRVVHNGVSPRVVESSRRDEVLGRFGLRGETYVFWVGSLEPRKGVETLVEAAAELRRRDGSPHFRLVLAGYDGWLQPQLVAEEVVQLGRVNDEELWALYAGATVFAFPSIHEGFGLPVLEAMSQGLPVVASDIPALREVTKGASVLVKAGDAARWAQALGDLLESPVDRERLAAAGRVRSEELSTEAMISRTRDVYRELTGH